MGICADFYQYLDVIDDISVACTTSILHFRSLRKADTLLHTHSTTLIDTHTHSLTDRHTQSISQSNYFANDTRAKPFQNLLTHSQNSRKKVLGLFCTNCQTVCTGYTRHHTSTHTPSTHTLLTHRIWKLRQCSKKCK